MSHNTNTLFWVITGAVIILAIFTLVNFSQNRTLKRINGVINSYWTGEEYDEEDYSAHFQNQEIDESYSIPRYACKSNVARLDGYRVQIFDYHDNGEGLAIIRWLFTNKNDYKVNKIMWIGLYECETNEHITSLVAFPQYTEPKETEENFTQTISLNKDYSYYIKLSWGN